MGWFRKKGARQESTAKKPRYGSEFDQRLVHVLAQYADDGPRLETAKHLKMFDAVLRADLDDVNADWTPLLNRLPSIIDSYLDKRESKEYSLAQIRYGTPDAQSRGNQLRFAMDIIEEYRVVLRARRAWVLEVLEVVSALGNADLTFAVKDFFDNPMHADILVVLDNVLVDTDKKEALARYLDNRARSVVKYVVDAVNGRAETVKMLREQNNMYAKAMANSNADVLLSQIQGLTP